MNERMIAEAKLVMGVLTDMGHAAMANVVNDLLNYCKAQKEIKEKIGDNKEIVKENVAAEKLLERTLRLIPKATATTAPNGAAWAALRKDIKTWLKADENPGEELGSHG